MKVLDRDRTFYLSAVSMARLSDYSTRVGSVAAVNRKRIAGAFNTVRSDPNNVPHGSATFHAEHNCVSMVPYRLRRKATLYIARLGRMDQELPSRPCSRCFRLLRFYRTPDIVYLGTYGELVKEKISDT